MPPPVKKAKSEGQQLGDTNEKNKVEKEEEQKPSTSKQGFDFLNRLYFSLFCFSEKKQSL